MYACGDSSKNSSDVPVVKQYSLPSSPLTQFIEQSVLMCLPAASPTGSSLANSPCIAFGGTTAFQMPPPGASWSTANAPLAATHRAAQTVSAIDRRKQADSFMAAI